MNPISTKPKLGIAHPYIGRGGSESALLWAAEGLKDDFDVAIITTGGMDFEAVNQYYGVALSPDEMRVDSPALAWLPGGLRGDAMRGALHQRHCRKVAPRYDALISAYNPCDFGRPAIHRIADFGWRPDICAKFDERPERSRELIHRDNRLRRAYLATARSFAKPSGRNLFDGEDILVVNSEWTRSVMRDLYPEARLELLYPPVAGELEEVPWEQRDNGFVCLGRIAAEKRVEDVIEVLSKVRALGHNIKLHLIGGRDNTSYGDKIKGLVHEAGDWAKLEGRLSGRDKKKLLIGNRYAIHACLREAFGIAVAEMVKAGCLPFVPNSGGPPEIVGHEPALCWGDVDDAVRKIDAVLRSEIEQRRLCESLRRRAELFSVDSYQKGVRRLVDEMLQRTAKTAENDRKR